jgi:hypothetical protein
MSTRGQLKKTGRHERPRHTGFIKQLETKVLRRFPQPIRELITHLIQELANAKKFLDAAQVLHALAYGAIVLLSLVIPAGDTCHSGQTTPPSVVIIDEGAGETANAPQLVIQVNSGQPSRFHCA